MSDTAVSAGTGESVPIYDSATRSAPAIEEAQEAYRYRHLIFEFIRRDIVTRYKRSILGVMWTMLNPLGMMLVQEAAKPIEEIVDGQQRPVDLALQLARVAL